MLNTPLPPLKSYKNSRDLYQSDAGAARVQVLSNLHELTLWESAWHALEQDSTASMTYFQNFDWCHAWMNAQRLECTPHVFLVFEGDELVAVWPLMRQKLSGGFYVLRSLGEPHSQYANILTRDGTVSAKCITVLRSALRHAQNVDTLILNYVPQTSPLVDILPQQSLVPSMANEACYLELSIYKDVADYWAKAGKRKRYNRKKALAVLSDLGEVRLCVLHPGDKNYKDMIIESLAMKQVWLRQTGRFSVGLAADFHLDFINALQGADNEGATLFVLMAGNRPIAFELGFLHKGHFNCYMISYGWRYRYASPGTLLIAMVIEWLIERGAKTFDLLGNPEDYKRSWTNVALPLSGHIYNFTWRGAIYSHIWARRLRPLLKLLYRSMPARLRSSLNIMRRINIPLVL